MGNKMRIVKKMEMVREISETEIGRRNYIDRRIYIV
jgi:hypothetical protein